MKKNRSFTHFIIIWSGQLLSSIGNGLTGFALGIFVFQQTGSATSYSLIILASFLPSLLLKPIGGVICDRLDRRLIMILGDLGSAMSLFFILVMMMNGHSEMVVIYGGIISSSLFSAFQNPAYKASVTDILNEESFSKASGLMQLAESSKFLISPIIAGILMNLMNVKAVLAIDVSSFLLATLTVLIMKKKILPAKSESGKKQGCFLEAFASGFNYLFSRKSLLWLLLITSMVSFFIGFLQSLLGPMILVFASAETLGLVTSVSASGMILSSFFIGLFGKSEKKIPILSISLLLAGIFFSSLGISTNILFIMGSGFLFFMALPFINTSLDVLVRRNVDNHMQGRVWSIVSLISQFGMFIALASAGFLADSVFNPLLLEDGLLSPSIGKLTGIGPGRGIGFLFILSGLFVSLIALFIGKLRILRELDEVKS